jgi:hypothetical protein
MENHRIVIISFELSFIIGNPIPEPKRDGDEKKVSPIIKWGWG